MNESNQLREQIWDLIYDLVTDEDRRAIIERIKSDPQAARMYSEARLEADLVGEASRVNEPSLALRDPDAKVQLAPRAPVAVKPRKSDARGVPGSDASRISTRLLGIAASALLVLLATGWFWPQPNAREIASRFVITAVEAPRAMSAGLTNNLIVRTARIGGDGGYGEYGWAAPASVELKLRGASGRELLHQQVATSSEGYATVELPGGALEPGVVLELASSPVSSMSEALGDKEMDAGAGKSAAGGESSLFVALPVQEEPQVAYLLLENPVAAADQPMRYASWNFGSFSNKPAGADATKIVAKGLAEVTTGTPSPSSSSDYNVLNGTLPAATPASEPTKESLAFQVQNKLGEVTRQRSLARNQALPALRGGSLNAPADKQESLARGEAAAVEKPALQQQLAQQAGRGPIFNAAPMQLEQNRARGLQIRRGQERAAGAARQTTAFDVGQAAMVPAGQALDVQIPEELENRSLFAAAICRGVTVATAPFPADDETARADEGRQLTKSRSLKGALELPPEADGLIDVVLVDQTSNPPQLVQQSAVYRQPAKALSIGLAGLKNRFAPGEQVRLEMRVADEAGAPVSNALVGVRVWNEEAVKSTEELPLVLTDAVRGVSGAAATPSQAENESLAKQLSDEYRIANAATAPRGRFNMPKDADRVGGFTPLDARAIAPLGESPAEIEAVASEGEKIVLASNRAEVIAEYDEAVLAARSRRQTILERIGRVVFVGSILILLLAALEIARRRSGLFQMAGPALVVGLASLFAGVSWIGWLPQAGEEQIALAPRGEDRLSRGYFQESEVGQVAATATPPAAAAPVSPLASAGFDALSAESQPATPATASPLADNKNDSEALGAKLAREGGVRLQEGAEAKRKLADAPAGTPALAALAAAAPAKAPPSLYFNPQLLTDASGRVTIEFNMPPVAAEYRLLIDALGNGRIGSQQQVITSLAN